MTDSILNSIKKLLGIAEDDHSFDQDVLMHINTILMVVAQEWHGRESFRVEDASDTWEDFIGEDNIDYDGLKTLVYLRVRLLFDPPNNSFVIQSMNEQIKELEWRMYTWKDNERILQNGKQDVHL